MEWVGPFKDELNEDVWINLALATSIKPHSPVSGGAALAEVTFESGHFVRVRASPPHVIHARLVPPHQP